MSGYDNYRIRPKNGLCYHFVIIGGVTLGYAGLRWIISLAYRWHDPKRYALFLRQFLAVMTPDFSMFTDYPKAVQIYNHWRKHQLGAYWQTMGMTVIPSISWCGEESFEWCFDGEPVESTVAVSSIGTQKSQDAKRCFLIGYQEMISRLRPSKVIFFGSVPKECVGNIEYHPPYYETFTHGLPFISKEW